MDEKVFEPIDKEMPTLDLQSFDKSNDAPVMFPSQISTLMPTGVKTVEAQSQDPYCQNVQWMVSVESARIFNETKILNQKLSLNGSIHVVVPQKYSATVLHNAYYFKLAGHLGNQRKSDSLLWQYY